MAQSVPVTHSDFSTCPLLRLPALATPALTQLISTPVARPLQSAAAPRSLLCHARLPECPVLSPCCELINCSETNKVTISKNKQESEKIMKMHVWTQ